MKLIFAAIAIASIAANIFFIRGLWGGSDPVAIRTITTDEPVVMRTKGGLLEVSSIKSPERFEASQNHTIAGIFVGKTISRIRVPAVFRYHIELAPEWKILLRDKTFIVVAPPVTPTLPVAIDTASLESESSGTWSLITGQKLIDDLQRSISAGLAEKAKSRTYVELQREEARKTVAEFVTRWLITQDRWKSTSDHPVRVFFSDEPIRVLGTLPPPFVAP
ncbi:MAG TPA: hypothetical protein VIY86_12165 [Pirellulaceae bacterium]